MIPANKKPRWFFYFGWVALNVTALLVLVMIGVTMALPQSWILRQQVRHASWWLLAYGSGWWVIGLLNPGPIRTIPALPAVAGLVT